MDGFLTLSFEPVLQTTAWPHCISGQMLISHSMTSSSRTVRPCSPWRGWWIGHWRITWSTVCSSAPHSQAAEKAIPNLYRQERKRPTPVRRRLSRTQALLWRVATVGYLPVSGMKMRGLVGLSAHSAFHWWSAHCAARMLLSDKLMSCCAADTNGCLHLRRRAFALDGQMSAEWSRCPRSMAQRARDSVASLRRSSVGWMSAAVGRRHPVTIRKASLMAGSVRQVWALRHQTGAQYSAVELVVILQLRNCFFTWGNCSVLLQRMFTKARINKL